MTVGRDVFIVILVSVVGIFLTLSALFSANERIRDWQNEFAFSNENPVFFSTSLLMEHHRLLQAMASFVRGDEHASKTLVLERLDIYWSRYELIDANRHMFDTPSLMKTKSWLPPDSHTEILQASMETITHKLIPALQRVEQRIEEMQAGDYREYMQIRAELDAYGDALASLKIASFERQRYLDFVQLAMSEQLRSLFRNALFGISVGFVLLSYLYVLYLRQRNNTTEKLRIVNNQLRLEVHESERLAHELSLQASHDSLSGLINRFGFNRVLDRQLESPQGHHGLCFVDLDLFKVVNDTCGHAAGDELIREVSSLLRASLPDGAIVARFGGDEFVILMCDCEQTVFEQAILRCCSDMKEYSFKHYGQQFDVSGSFGAAFLILVIRMRKHRWASLMLRVTRPRDLVARGYISTMEMTFHLRQDSMIYMWSLLYRQHFLKRNFACIGRLSWA